MSPLNKTVLVIEDNDLNMKLFHDVLEADGYNVLQATDGSPSRFLLPTSCRPSNVSPTLSWPSGKPYKIAPTGCPS